MIQPLSIGEYASSGILSPPVALPRRKAGNGFRRAGAFQRRYQLNSLKTPRRRFGRAVADADMPGYLPRQLSRCGSPLVRRQQFAQLVAVSILQGGARGPQALQVVDVNHVPGGNSTPQLGAIVDGGVVGVRSSAHRRATQPSESWAMIATTVDSSSFNSRSQGSTVSS